MALLYLEILMFVSERIYKHILPRGRPRTAFVRADMSMLIIINQGD